MAEDSDAETNHDSPPPPNQLQLASYKRKAKSKSKSKDPTPDPSDPTIELTMDTEFENEDALGGHLVASMQGVSSFFPFYSHTYIRTHKL